MKREIAAMRSPVFVVPRSEISLPHEEFYAFHFTNSPSYSSEVGAQGDLSYVMSSEGNDCWFDLRCQGGIYRLLLEMLSMAVLTQ